MRVESSILLFVIGLSGCASERALPAAGRATRASLGIETVAPTESQAAELGLATRVRQQGRIIERVEPDAPAARAGLCAGDALLAVGGVELYSQDDLDDLLRASIPGAALSIRFKRPGQPEERTVTATLGSEPAPASPGIAWRHASLASLPRALEEARATGKNALVGLSGAET